ncbi:LOW QUALITY PROTEIN: nucleolar protein 8 [Colossoma macropomum]|uniref:LOW QUALITY PROTEIN: nucleolar protein 8 n=1 Tax=Colossoma macropomum TaxID=42526 RepID=UPI001864692C|nr:LOW QUALITY PROTEIN: nucleolar protein 8 [Colossoma macropomum]
MKRLYIGGLSHTVSEKDLRDRFGKFGEVSDAEIITRKDEHGSPLKTFGYINISISDSDYKKCLTVLNKSKWKGGTIQIELAKESFLHRLAEERQKAAEKAQTPRTDPQKKIVESFKAAGVENFHMKAAVPGTEIPGHKNWVVSKFGRVLPVLQLKCQGKNKVFKYDPSKHCHNIKKLDAVEDITPVSKLTWELDGGYDEISKKRRGEFPPQKKCLKKTRTDLSVSAAPHGTTVLTASEKRTSAQSRGGDLSARQVKQNPPVKPVHVLDSDADSEDEIRMLVAHERSQIQKAASVEEEDDNLEVVGDDFVVKSNMFWGGENGVRALLASKSSKSDEEYDSADTDEILTQKKMPGKAEEPDVEDLGENSVDKTSKGDVKKVKKKARDAPKPQAESDSSDESSSESVDSDYEAMMGNCYRLDLSLADLENLVKNAEELSDDEESDGAVSEPHAGPSELPKTSPPRAPSKKSGNNPEDILASLFEPDMENEEPALKSSLPAFVGTKDLFGSSPSGSCLKRPAEKTDHESREEPKRPKEDQLTVPKKSSLEDQLSESSHLSASVDPQPKVNSAPLPHTSSSSECSSSSDEMESSEDDRPETVKVNSRTHSVPKNQTMTTGSPPKRHHRSLKAQAKLANERATPASATDSSNSSTSTEESESSDEEEEKGNNTEAVQKHSSVASSIRTNSNAASHPKPLQQSVSDTVKQQQDNQKRLAALEQRKKEAEQQKKLIQGALSKLDVPNANKGKHIVFDSDDEDDETPAPQKKTLFEEATDSDEEDGSGAVETQHLKEKECKKAGGSKLFDSSEDEDDEENRFQIKPQFEGKAGQKLMELQSRFGTDPRFQMDAKFLENDEEEEEEDAGSQVPAEQELIEEKKKNLAILQSVVNVSIEPSDTTTKSAKAKTFRDMSALHYDPTSDAHSAFEAKTEAPKNESKAARRKKREEAEKLPEVSKEIYYDVAVDLKEVFGTSTHSQNEKKEELSWDKEEDENEDEATGQDVHMWSLSSSVETEKDASSAFKFSFFGDDTADTTTKTDEYKIETLKGPKVSWQVDPRFQDSSSDEDDVEEDEEHKDQSASTTVTTEEPAPTTTFFFFFEDDIRLKEGPRMFWRSQKLEDQREAWEEKRAQLREEYRKKHKDAKRRQKSTMKN